MFRTAALLLLAYALIVLANGFFYLSWSKDGSDLPRMFVRVGGMVVIAYGLWRSTKWGWWAGLLFAGIFSLLGLVGFMSLLATGQLSTRPYPLVDVTAIGLSTLALVGTFICLVSGKARSVVRNGNNAAT
jgi:hypothetical protein